ncbi:glycosyltransferase family 1 protein [bacterium]|nr:MAG: glycosyltransferase family 1 protein [bacterium]
MKSSHVECEKTAKPKLLYIITKAELGGAQSHVLDLIRGFVNSYELHLAVGALGPLTEIAKQLGAKVHLLSRLQRSINPLADILAVRECVTLLRRVRPDLVHCHSSKAGIIGRLAGQFAGIPVIFTAHGWGFSPGVPRLRRKLALQIERAMAPLASKIICVSEFDYRLARDLKVGKKRKLVTVHNGIADSGSGSRLANTENQPPSLIMVARFSQQKDHPILFRALANVHEDWHLQLVGSGPNLSTCQELAQSLDLTNRISFLGDRSDVAELLTNSQCFVLASQYEGLPISILEAMRAGLPIIATHVGGVGEQIERDQTGLLVPANDAAALEEALRYLVRSPELRQRMGQAGRQKFENLFTSERMIAAIGRIYSQVLHGKAA